MKFIMQSLLEELKSSLPDGDVTVSSYYLIVNKEFSSSMVEYFKQLNFETNEVSPFELSLIKVS